MALRLSASIGVVTAPGEIFTEIGQSIVARSPFPQTLYATYTNGTIGYVPTRAAYAEGGYEVTHACQVAPDAGARTLRTLAPRTPVQVEGAAGRAYRVRTPDGLVGYVAAAGTASADAPLERARPAAATPVLDRPAPTGVALDSVARGRAVPVLGQFGDYLLVRAPGGRAGWMATD